MPCTVTPASAILGISLDIFTLVCAHSFLLHGDLLCGRLVLLVGGYAGVMYQSWLTHPCLGHIDRISLDIFTLDIFTLVCAHSFLLCGRSLPCRVPELTDSPLLTILTGYLWKWSLWIWSLRYARTAFFCMVGHSLVVYQGWLTHPCLDRSYTRRTGGILTKVRHGCFGNLGLFSSTFLTQGS